MYGDVYLKSTTDGAVFLSPTLTPSEKPIQLMSGHNSVPQQEYTVLVRCGEATTTKGGAVVGSETVELVFDATTCRLLQDPNK